MRGPGLQLDAKATLSNVVEICDIKRCNSCLFFEVCAFPRRLRRGNRAILTVRTLWQARKRQDMYLWMARTPAGPSVKFHVSNSAAPPCPRRVAALTLPAPAAVHTMDELKLTGNCLLGSRPLLQFDPHFDSVPHLQLLKEMFTQVCGGRPRSPRRAVRPPGGGSC